MRVRAPFTWREVQTRVDYIFRRGLRRGLYVSSKINIVTFRGTARVDFRRRATRAGVHRANGASCVRARADVSRFGPARGDGSGRPHPARSCSPNEVIQFIGLLQIGARRQ